MTNGAQATGAGVKLHHVEAGAGDPALVFVPGWCCDHRFFQPQFDHFQARHRVVALDPRGCGRSEVTDEGYDVPTLADDVAGLCRALGVERPVVVGHSLGGMVAVEIAARHPSLPRAVVAVDPGPLAIRAESKTRFEAFIAALEGPDSAVAREEYIEGMFLPADDAGRKRWITETMCAAPPHVALAMLRGVIEWNGPTALRRCTVPLLVLQSDPNVGGSNDAGRLLALNPGIQFGVTVGAGHFHQLEVPDQVNSMLDRFVRTLG